MKPTIVSSSLQSEINEKESISRVSISKEMMSKLPVIEQYVIGTRSQFVNGEEFLSSLKSSGRPQMMCVYKHYTSIIFIRLAWLLQEHQTDRRYIIYILI